MTSTTGLQFFVSTKSLCLRFFCPSSAKRQDKSSKIVFTSAKTKSRKKFERLSIKDSTSAWIAGCALERLIFQRGLMTSLYRQNWKVAAGCSLINARDSTEKGPSLRRA